MDGLPFSQAAENNREPILAELRPRLAQAASVVEIGAGTGQHAVFFAAAMPWLRWLPTERAAALPTLRPRCEAAGLANLARPQALDLVERPWAVDWPDAIYTANTLHIVSRDLVQALFAACADQATPASLLIVYGPFNYNGTYTSESNARFDQWLRARDAQSGVRDFEWVDALAADAGYALEADVAMPANNRLLCWRRRAQLRG